MPAHPPNTSNAIELVTGGYFDMLEPHPDAVSLHAIAQGLSQTCRFGGQSRRY
jgi:hypothetical protein